MAINSTSSRFAIQQWVMHTLVSLSCTSYLAWGTLLVRLEIWSAPACTSATISSWFLKMVNCVHRAQKSHVHVNVVFSEPSRSAAFVSNNILSAELGSPVLESSSQSSSQSISDTKDVGQNKSRRRWWDFKLGQCTAQGSGYYRPVDQRDE